MTTQTTQDAQLIEEFLAMIRRDAARITDPGEMLAMARVIVHVLGGEHDAGAQGADRSPAKRVYA